MEFESGHLLVSTFVVAASIVGLPLGARGQSVETAHQVQRRSTLQALPLASCADTFRLDGVIPAKAQPAPTAQRRDSLWNGLLIGAGVGALAGLIPDYYDDCEECHDSLYASIAVGAGIGVLIDLLRDGNPSPSPSRNRDEFRMDVAVHPRVVRVSGSIAWR